MCVCIKCSLKDTPRRRPCIGIGEGGWDDMDSRDILLLLGGWLSLAFVQTTEGLSVESF